MKRFAAVTLALGLVGTLAACGDKGVVDNAALSNEATLNEFVAPDEANLLAANNAFGGNDAALVNTAIDNANVSAAAGNGF